MRKKMLYYLYLIDEDKQTPEQKELYNIHYLCLKHYSNVFDDMHFVFSVDDVNNVELVKKWEEKLLKFHNRGSITFEIHKNDEYCESGVFKSHLIDKLNENELVFFGHGKGLTNVLKHPKDIIFSWVMGLYFYSLNFMEEMEQKLQSSKAISFGSFMTNNKYEDTTKYKWFYIGTFFWVNAKKLLSYIKTHNIEFPILSDRFYSEEFLGNVYPTWPKPYAGSHNNFYMLDTYDYYKNYNEILDILYANHEDCDEFCEQIKKELNEL